MSLPSVQTEIPVFLSSTDLKAAIGTDSENPRIAECAIAANSHVTLAIKPYAETTPIEPGSSTYEQATRVALMYAQYLWYLKVFQADVAESYRRGYVDALKELKESLRVEPTPRQEPLHIQVSDFASERKVPYSQVGFAGDTENLY